MGIGVGVDSRGLSPESLSSESESSSASISRIPPSQLVSRPNACRSFTPQVRTLLSWVRAAACMPPVAISTTPTDFASRLVFRRGLFTSIEFLVPRPSSPALPSPKTKTSSLVVGAAFSMGFCAAALLLLVRRIAFDGALAALTAGALTRVDDGGFVISSRARRFLEGIAVSWAVSCRGAILITCYESGGIFLIGSST